MVDYCQVIDTFTPQSTCQEDEAATKICAGVLHLQVQDADGWIAFFPGPFSKLTSGVDHSHIAPIIGTQWYTWHSDDTHFRCADVPAGCAVFMRCCPIQHYM